MCAAIDKEQTVDFEIRIVFVDEIVINRYQRIYAAGNARADQFYPPRVTVSNPLTVNEIGLVRSENRSKIFIR